MAEKQLANSLSSNGPVHQTTRWLLGGLLFSVLWASASTATKIGLSAAQPLVIAEVRFGIAAAIMLLVAHAIGGHRLPKGKEWKHLAIYGSLNISLYLGSYVVAMQTVTAGIGALAIATNPIFISFLSVFFLKKKLTLPILAALLICTLGVFCAAWPLLGDASVTTKGLLILLLSMLSYSVATIYFAARPLKDLHLFAINGWQTLFGGLILSPVAFFFYKPSGNEFTTAFWGAVLWLAVPVSIFAVQIWLWLLRVNAVKAGLWLFLCPVFGFAIAAWLVNDPINMYTIAGVLLVLAGLYISQRSRIRQ